jgi:hypothetical protein
MDRPPQIFLSSVFDETLRAPIFTECCGRFWLEKPLPASAFQKRSIEDICRDMIRGSIAFIGLFDGRGGRALAFAGVKTPVTVLEIELVQALLQRMPTYLFILPGFEANERLRGLVRLIEDWRLAPVTRWKFSGADREKPALPVFASQIVRLARHPRLLWFAGLRSRIAQRFRLSDNLEIQFLNREFELFSDPFDTEETSRLIDVSATQQDHASRLAMLWAAVRQLCSVPFTEKRFAHTRPLWERALNEWVRSAAWYGLHDDSPIGLLSAVNSVIWIRAQASAELIPEDSPIHIHGTKGARASALYSMAKRRWWPVHRWSLLAKALSDVEAAISTRPKRLSNYLAIRGSLYRMQGRFNRAIKDHEAMVALRKQETASASGMGEALSELGWTYAWSGRFLRARRCLIEGVRLLSEGPISSPSEAGFRLRALRKCNTVQALMLDFAGARRTRAEAQRVANKYLVRDQMRAESRREWPGP